MFALTSQSKIFEKTKVNVSKDLITLWRASRQVDNITHEAFGVLIGSQSMSANEFWLEKCTTPQKTDSATRRSFNLRAPYHQNIVNSFYKSSNGIWGYVGTWHTHPEPTPVPSVIDIADWHECTKRNPDRGLIFVIVGQMDVCIFRTFGGSFKRICKERIDD